MASQVPSRDWAVLSAAPVGSWRNELRRRYLGHIRLRLPRCFQLRLCCILRRRRLGRLGRPGVNLFCGATAQRIRQPPAQRAGERAHACSRRSQASQTGKFVKDTERVRETKPTYQVRRLLPQTASFSVYPRCSMMTSGRPDDKRQA